MREVNFSVPNANKASVGITTALYDRRALDCTSTLPLINSLNHLAYLTTSSARIRDILTIDGGIERLVVILKEGRSKDLMSMWKWNLAFQCVVNIGVRGSESVRTRVVEADMVPVIATILDNYSQVVERVRAKAEAANARRNVAALRARTTPQSMPEQQRSINRPTAPHSIDIPQSNNPLPPRTDFLISNAPPQTQTGNVAGFSRFQPSPAQDNRQYPIYTGIAPVLRGEPTVLQPMAPALPAMDNITMTGFGPLRVVREADRLPSMLQAGGPSQPVSPTTPNPPGTGTPYNQRIAQRNGRLSIRHQRSMSGESDDANAEMPNQNVGVVGVNETLVDIQNGVDMVREDLLESVNAPMELGGQSDPQDAETFNITHRSPIDGSIMINPTANVNPAMGFSPNPPTANPTLGMPGPFQAPPRFMVENAPSSVVLPSMPREEDVLMSLQLLAYVSKYCDLRSYFQYSHLVPRLSIHKELHLLDDDGNGQNTPAPCSHDDDDEEYLLPDDFNLFPLVEKFTVRHHPQDMQYWAGVDDSRGGIRQCANYECGKWEEFTRQFAKCRRCRRTKYCSKECQKRAWVYHRHWCVAAQP
ncbi:hypothetical protein EDC01DRAFT_715352 [Geopyxis carbonaria]|nr:hypothetical protein EDC01DRAFT_715352 [Geopyxis carbonaria]